MAKIKAKDLREKTSQELLDQQALEKKRLFDATVRGASGEAIKAHEKREGKRLIARIQTILQERRIRQELEPRMAALEPLSKGASPRAAALVRREPRPALGRVRLTFKGAPTAADRAAIRLAEAKRLSVCLTRDDPGQNK